MREMRAMTLICMKLACRSTASMICKTLRAQAKDSLNPDAPYVVLNAYLLLIMVADPDRSKYFIEVVFSITCRSQICC